MKRITGYLALTILLCSLANTAHAVNPWYTRGFADGIVHNEQQCANIINQRARIMSQENARLRAEIDELRAASNAAPASEDLLTSNQYPQQFQNDDLD